MIRIVCKILQLHLVIILLSYSSNACQLCGENTTCSTLGGFSNCSCMKRYSGDPLKCYFKMNEVIPCSPNPCGNNSICIESDPKLGPHCECLNDFYGWPPNCSRGCTSDFDCKEIEICNLQNKCENLCNPSRCGKNSVCRVDREEDTINCSCKEGYIPQPGTGCRLKTSSDEVVLVESLRCKDNQECPKYICDNFCPETASCNRFDGKIECNCLFNIETDDLKPFKNCSSQEFVTEQFAGAFGDMIAMWGRRPGPWQQNV